MVLDRKERKDIRILRVLVLDLHFQLSFQRDGLRIKKNFSNTVDVRINRVDLLGKLCTFRQDKSACQ